MVGTESPIVVVGLGSIGKRHVRNLKALTERPIVAVRRSVDPKTDSELGIISVPSLSEALALKPYAAVIANPTTMHTDVALSFVRAGVPFLLEKPVSDRLDGLDVLQHEISSRKLPCLVGYNLRFNEGLRTVKRFIDEGAIGRVYHAQISVGSYMPGWRPGTNHLENYGARKELGGGVVLDLSHEIDYAQWLFGRITSLVSNVSRKAANVTVDTEDLADILAETEKGVSLNIHLDYLNHKYRRDCVVVGEKGTLQWDFKGKSVILTKADGSSETKSYQQEVNDMYVDLVRHFIECVENKTSPLVTLDDGISALKVGLKAKDVGSKSYRVE